MSFKYPDEQKYYKGDTVVVGTLAGDEIPNLWLEKFCKVGDRLVVVDFDKMDSTYLVYNGERELWIHAHCLLEHDQSETTKKKWRFRDFRM